MEIQGTNISMIRGDSESINNLTSTAIDKALSANMGRELFQSVSNGKGLIATAITDKGGSASGSDTLGELATAITNLPSGGGVIDLVGSLTHSGEYSGPSYLTAKNSRMAGNSLTGEVILVLQGGQTSLYENIIFVIETAPAGVALFETPQANWSYINPTQRLFCCVITGVYQKINVNCNMNARDSVNDTVTASLQITYA